MLKEFGRALSQPGGETKTPVNERKDSTKFLSWDSDTFKEYLFAVSRDEQFIESFANYPNSIAPGDTTHQAFNNLREVSQEREYVSVTATDLLTRRLWVQTTPAPGRRYAIPGELVKEQKRKAKAERGADKTVFYVHSHPHPLWREYGDRNGKLSSQAILSVADLYNLVGNPHESVYGLVEGWDNLLIFRSRESCDMDKFPYISRLNLIFKSVRELFSDYWHSKHGMQVIDKNGIECLSRLDGNHGRLGNKELEELMLDVASFHKLVIYRGKMDRELERIYPNKQLLTNPGVE